MTNYISTGGLGDAWIAALKLKQFNLVPVKSWLHVESNNNIEKAFKELFPTCDFECDPDYIQHYKEGKWKDYTPVSSGIDSWCPLKGDTKMELTYPFHRTSLSKTKQYDVCLQVSAGAKNNRKWNFNPLLLQSILIQKGMSCVLVGSDSSYEEKDNQLNFVGKLSLKESLEIMERSKLFVGLSGFLNYYACSRQIKNIHLIESEENERRYYHEAWSKIWTTGIKYGTIIEILREIND